jgi:hypothetical protein
MPYINWHETVLTGIFVNQILANYALVLNGVVRVVPVNSRANRIIIMNNSSSPIYLGADSTVNASNGFPILPNDVVVFSFIPSLTRLTLYLYGENQEIRVLEIY